MAVLATTALVALSVCAPAAASWQKLPSVNYNLRAVDFVNQNLGWAGGDDDYHVDVGVPEWSAVVIGSTSGGEGWNEGFRSEMDMTAVDALDFVDANKGWATQSDGAILYSGNGGQTWQVQAEGSAGYFDYNWGYSDIEANDVNHGWAVGGFVGFAGDPFPQVAYTTNGRDWEGATVPQTADGWLESVSFPDNAHGWAVGALFSAGSPGTPVLLVSSDGGATWDDWPYGVSGISGTGFNGVWFVDTQTGWAVGGGGTILSTSNGGGTWQRQTSPSAVTLRDVSFVDAKHGWIVGDGGTLLETSDGGLHWTKAVTGTNANLYALSFSDSSHGWAVGLEGTVLAGTFDLTFSPKPDGWQFANGTDYVPDDEKAIWDEVFSPQDPAAQLGYQFLLTASRLNSPLSQVPNAGIFSGGVCYGMSASAASYFDQQGLAQQKVGASTPWDATFLDRFDGQYLSSEVRREVELYHIAQFTRSVAKTGDTNRLLHKVGNGPGLADADYRTALSAWLGRLEEAVKSGPQIIELISTKASQGQSGGHAVVAYEVVRPGGSSPYIRVYDPNHPEYGRPIVVSTNEGGWRYDLFDDTVWTSNDEGNSITFYGPEVVETVVRSGDLFKWWSVVLGADQAYLVDAAGHRSGDLGGSESWTIPGVRPWAPMGFIPGRLVTAARFFELADGSSVSGVVFQPGEDGKATAGYFGSDTHVVAEVARDPNGAGSEGADKIGVGAASGEVELTPGSSGLWNVSVAGSGAVPLSLEAKLSPSPGGGDEAMDLRTMPLAQGFALELDDRGALTEGRVKLGWVGGTPVSVQVSQGALARIELVGGVASGSQMGDASMKVQVDVNRDGVWDTTITGTLPAPGNPGGGTSFTDTASSPYRVAIEDLAGAGIISGYPDGTFRPDNPVLRQHFAKMIVLSLGISVSQADICPFGDVDQGGSTDPLYPDHYVAVAAANGITYGMAPGIFGPYLDITRAQLITMVVRAAERLMPGVIQESLLSATMYDAGPHTESIQRAAASGLLDGLVGYGDPSWNPWTGASRGEVAQILDNLREHEGQDSSTPAAPTNLAAVALSSSSIRFTWADVSNETGYIIMQGGVTARWTEVGRTAANVTTFTNTGLLPSKDYFYMVVAYNSAGTAWSADYVYATTLASGYTVGGTGPAGGIIFYDKGSYGDGWRYLEAAPASTEWRRVPWGVYGFGIPGVGGILVGTGRQNTAAIIASQGPGSTYAAQLCDGLTSGGFSDWFLPSRDELGLIYTNLYLYEFGGFGPEAYWSSSDEGGGRPLGLDFDGSTWYIGSEGSADWVRAVRAF